MSDLLPEFDAAGNLPPGIYQATFSDVLSRFGSQTSQRRNLGERLHRLIELVTSTGKLQRFVLFGSFVTSKPEPRDLDIFLVMSDNFEKGEVSGDVEILFDHAQAEVRFGASVFWLRPQTCLNGVEAAINDWKITRDGTERGIVEIIGDEE